MKNTLLLSGESGAGKSTMIRRLHERSSDIEIRGFHSPVLYEGTRRLGWELYGGRRGSGKT